MHRRKLALVAVAVVAMTVTGASAARIIGGADLRSLPTSAAQVRVADAVGADRDAADRCYAAAGRDEQALCLDGLVQRVATMGRYGTAIGIVDEMMRNPELSVKCHTITHNLGQTMFRQGMPLDEVYAIGWMDCAMGVPHGAIDAAAQELDREALATSFGDLCDGLATFGEFAIINCIHAIAHVVATQWDADVDDAFEVCRALGSDTRIGTCVYGLVMQYAVLADPQQEMFSSSFRDAWAGPVVEQTSRAVDLCETLPAEAAASCATITPGLWAVLWSGDWSSIHTACATFTGELRIECFKGIAAAVMSFNGTNALEVLPAACQAGAGASACIEGAGKSYGYMNPSADADEQICGLFEGAEQYACRRGFTTGARNAGKLNGSA